jgi:hypothetical protein
VGDRIDLLFQSRALAPQIARTLRVLPDIGLFEFAADLR